MRGLFGRYDYDLELSRPGDDSESRIAILYGDNGSGKTTILRLLFHLLSPAHRRGHKTFVAGTPFRSFVVQFSDGRRVQASRDGPDLTGTFDVQLSKGRKKIIGTYPVDEEGAIPRDHSTPQTDAIEAEMADTGLSVFLLSDNRTLDSDDIGDENDELYTSSLEYSELMRMRQLGTRRRSPGPDQRDIALRDSLNRVTSWLRTRMIEQSSRGQTDAQQIYANVVSTINSGASEVEPRNRLVDELTALESRSGSFSDIGMVPKIRVKPLIDGLGESPADALPSVAQVVRSFLDDQNARLNALEGLNTLVIRFVDLINGFLIDKDMRINVVRGVEIVSDLNKPLKPETLSSGEKQLLLLLSNVLTASDSASLFIVDEPELSLNVKWQRQLVDALLEITQGSSCQFLFATHSMELLAKHRSQVVELTPSAES